RIDFPRDSSQVADIVDVARARNSGLSVTGALVFSEQSFAQVLEGPAAAVEELMASIERDPRHHRLSVLIDASLAAGRRFSDWSMAYSGPSLYVERHIRPLLQGELELPEAEAAERLLLLIEELTLRALHDETG
ncbi:MAG TPA: BLUF domain-containing protein, partial [Allosphingosinicella sp.]